jgi:hypothetical protein
MIKQQRKNVGDGCSDVGGIKCEEEGFLVDGFRVIVIGNRSDRSVGIPICAIGTSIPIRVVVPVVPLVG